MNNIVVSADYFKELVEKATIYDVIVAVYKGDNKYQTLDVIGAVSKECKCDGSSDCKES